MNRRLQLYKGRKCCTTETGLVVIALLMFIITTPTILQPTLAITATNLSANTTTATTTHTKNNTFTLIPSNQSSTSLSDKTNVTLRGHLTDLGDPGRWNKLLQPALDELNRRHPDMNIQIEYTDSPYNETRDIILDSLSSGDSLDIVSVGDLWLGQFAELGLLSNLTAEAEQWGKLSDLYEANLDGTVYNNTIYGLWLWTDIRGIWYWKDMLQEAGV
ncbi:MAG: extracellular solute-binding protein, partial [Nitrososphaera sp.]